MKALDTPYSTVNKAHDIARAGFGSVIRYISPNSGNFPNKRLTLIEAQGLHLAGLKIGVVWESGNPTRLEYFSGQQGKLDGMAAAAVAVGIRMPEGGCIFFAVDYDADSQDAVDGLIREYFEAVHTAVRAAGFLVGCYGPGTVLHKLIDAGLVHYGWVCQSTGFGGYDEAISNPAVNHIVQGPSTTVCGLDVDLDTINDPAVVW